MVILDHTEIIDAVLGHEDEGVKTLVSVIASKITDQLEMISFVADAANDVKHNMFTFPTKWQERRLQEMIEEADCAEEDPKGPQHIWPNAVEMLRKKLSNEKALEMLQTEGDAYNAREAVRKSDVNLLDWERLQEDYMQSFQTRRIWRIIEEYFE
jgi:hypothetical protein